VEAQVPLREADLLLRVVDDLVGVRRVYRLVTYRAASLPDDPQTAAYLAFNSARTSQQVAPSVQIPPQLQRENQAEP
jgi:hypothetical protein